MQNNIKFVFNMLQFDVVYSKGIKIIPAFACTVSTCPQGNRGDEKLRQYGVRKTVATLCPI